MKIFDWVERRREMQISLETLVKYLCRVLKDVSTNQPNISSACVGSTWNYSTWNYLYADIQTTVQILYVLTESSFRSYNSRQN